MYRYKDAELFRLVPELASVDVCAAAELDEKGSDHVDEGWNPDEEEATGVAVVADGDPLVREEEEDMVVEMRTLEKEISAACI